MVFASLPFLCVFLALNLILYFAIDNIKFRNWLLAISSLVFYAWGEPIFVSLLIFSAFFDYAHGLIIEKYRGQIQAKLAVWSSLIINLGILATFKYNVFIYENINVLLSPFNFQLEVPSGFALPIGISFYTFQTLSYVIDLYRGKAQVQKSFLNFLLYVCLYFQLVAGPIVRYTEVAKELDDRKSTSYDVFQGLLRFCIGLTKKLMVADVAGEFVRNYLGSGDFSTLSFGEAWFAIIMFSIQIYFDFSGYSDMAIGLARVFGFKFGENFNYPYISRSATEFWRRWHISLGGFFRDYVYIPLGGKYKRQYFNIAVVWFLTGLWHGATWNFVIWGVYFGALIMIEKVFLLNILENKLPRFVSHIYLLFIAVYGWAIFYFTDFSQLISFTQLLFGGVQEANGWWSPQLTIALQENCIWLIVACIACMPIYPKIANFMDSQVRNNNPILYAVYSNVVLLSLLFLSICMLVGNTYSPFIYERF